MSCRATGEEDVSLFDVQSAAAHRPAESLWRRSSEHSVLFTSIYETSSHPDVLMMHN